LGALLYLVQQYRFDIKLLVKEIEDNYEKGPETSSPPSFGKEKKNTR